MGITIKVTGTEALRKALASLKHEIVANLEAAVTETTQAIASEAQANCPTKTGALKASHVIEPVERHPGYVKQEQGYSAPYAYPVHEGINGHPNKWLENATESQASAFEAAVAAAFQKSVAKVSR